MYICIKIQIDMEENQIFICNEVWRPIKYYEGLYEISNLGRVKSLERVVKNHSVEKIKPESIKSLTVGAYGYYVVSLTKNGKTKTHNIHRLVAEAFLPNPNKLPCIDHINRIRTDNTVSINLDGSINIENTNLKWCSYKENNNNPNTRQYVTDCVDTKLRTLKALETKAKNNSKVARKQIFQYSKEGNLIASYSSIAHAAKVIGVSRHSIQSVLDDYSHTIKDSIWTTEAKDNIVYVPITKYSFYKPIQQIDQEGNVINEFQSVTSAARALHTCTKQIRRLIKRGKFRYVDT